MKEEDIFTSIKAHIAQISVNCGKTSNLLDQVLFIIAISPNTHTHLLVYVLRISCTAKWLLSRAKLSAVVLLMLAKAQLAP